uniref:LRIM1/APL1C-like dimerization domain-containing protein n=1 Tax=Anopheles maculatus TaxID=74869 RepID=A0A182T849_9DIPT
MVSLRICTVFLALVCVVSAFHQVKQQGSKYKIENVADITLKNALESIRPSAWNVKELDLSGNVLSKISAYDLTPFTNLELLNLSSNVLFESVDLRPLTKLQTVDLNNNFLTEVLVGPAIQTLYAANNNISTVFCYGERPSWANKRLYLANNKIGSLLSLDDACRRRVEYLDLKLNEIDMLDFGELADSSDTLKYLNLEYNFIFDVKNRGNVVFSQLDKFDLSWNKLAHLGSAFIAVSRAKSMNLSNNKLVLLGNVEFTRHQTITSFDLRGNGIQCTSLRNFFDKNKHLELVATNTVLAVTGQSREKCPETNMYEGPYCCENLIAPFADRLIDLKRKQYALFSGHRSEQERAECEQEYRARQQKMDSTKNQYRTKIDDETRRNQDKIQLMQKKKMLEEQLPVVENAYNELKNVLETTAAELQLTVSEDRNLLQLLRSIVQWYDQQYVVEQKKQSEAIDDWNMYQKRETELLEENARQKKLNSEVDAALQHANATLQEL